MFGPAVHPPTENIGLGCCVGPLSPPSVSAAAAPLLTGALQFPRKFPPNSLSPRLANKAWMMLLPPPPHTRGVTTTWHQHNLQAGVLCSAPQPILSGRCWWSATHRSILSKQLEPLVESYVTDVVSVRADVWVLATTGVGCTRGRPPPAAL